MEINTPKTIEQVAIKKLVPYARNSRTHSDIQVSQIAASIKEFVFTNPVLISDTYDIIAGHGRVLAAKKLGFDVVAVTADADGRDDVTVAVSALG